MEKAVPLRESRSTEERVCKNSGTVSTGLKADTHLPMCGDAIICIHTHTRTDAHTQTKALPQQ